LVRVIFMDEPLRTALVQRAEGVADQVAQLPDSLRENAPALADAFRKAEAAMVSADASIAQRGRTARDSALTKSMQYWLTTATGPDVALHVDSITGVLLGWGLPIGYTWIEPPLIWLDPVERVEATNLVAKDPLLRYYKERNANEHCVYGFYWIMGILLSSLALSAGSSFWFNLLVKLVNIRRAGAKPARSDEKEEA